MKRYAATTSLLLLFSLVFTCGACDENFKSRGPQGELTKQDRAVSGFDAVDIGGAFEVIIKQGSQESLTVEAESGIIDKIKTEVSGHTLKIYTEKDCCWDTRNMAIYLTVKDIRYLEISGACELKSEGDIRLDNLEMEVSGASEITLNFALSKLDLNLSGASELSLSGSCDDVYMETSGASEIDAINFKAGSMTIDASGASDCKVNVTEDLKVDASGATSVRYTGSATVNSSTSGASSVKAMK
jgi:hypothetical protein